MRVLLGGDLGPQAHAGRREHTHTDGWRRAPGRYFGHAFLGGIRSVPGGHQSDWRKSSFSDGTGNGNNCVELASLADGGIAVRDSKLADSGPVVTFTQAELRAFVLGVKAGEFDDLI